MANRFTNVIGFDDSPFDKHRDRRVLVVGAVYSDSRLVGVLSAYITPDGSEATATVQRMIQRSRFAGQAQAILLQGIAMAGFNVIDIHALHDALGIPVLTIARHAPDMQAIRQALFTRVENGPAKWRLISKAGPMEAMGHIFVQRAGLSFDDAQRIVNRFAVNGHIPEPLRTAHLIAGGIGRGESRGRT